MFFFSNIITKGLNFYPFRFDVLSHLEYKQDLDASVKKETSGDLKDILLQKLGGEKDKKGKKDKGSDQKDSQVDKKKAEDQAKVLHEVRFVCQIVLYILNFHIYAVTKLNYIFISKLACMLIIKTK